MSLKRRIENLEQSAGTGAEELLTIYITIHPGPRESDKAPARYRYENGKFIPAEHREPETTHTPALRA